MPALFVSGTLGGRTPQANALALLPGFADARHLLVSNASHDDELWLGHPDIAARIAGFLAARPVNDAVLEVQPPAFASHKFDLLLALGIDRWAVMAALATVATLPLVAFVSWRRWRRRSRLRVGDR